jgi:chemotaxis regulatin CheY-phosphate phosphatase CheZ
MEGIMGFESIKKKIRTAAYHIGVFDESFPKILADSGEFAAAQLRVFKEGLPVIKHLVRYAHSTVSSVSQISGVAEGGAAGLKKASDQLLELRRSTEEAANQIFDIFDKVDPLLEKVAEDEGVGEETKKSLQEARDGLQQLFSALQFQDIASQQIESVNALLSALSKDLVELNGADVDSDFFRIAVKEGTYDSNAKFRTNSEEESS